MFAVVQQTDLPASHQGRNGEKFGINRLPPNLTHIEDGAFEYCSGLTEIALPPGLTHIGDRAFAFCSGMTKITYRPGLTHIGVGAFSSCSGLTEIALPPGLTHIGVGAFSYCPGLTKIALPPGLTHIGVWAFSSCRKIKTVLITPDPAHRGKLGAVAVAVLHTDTVRRLKASATVRGWAPLALTLTTLGGDAVKVQLALPENLSADFTVGMALASAAAAKLGVPPEEVYIAAAVKDVLLVNDK